MTRAPGRASAPKSADKMSAASAQTISDATKKTDDAESAEVAAPDVDDEDEDRPMTMLDMRGGEKPLRDCFRDG